MTKKYRCIIQKFEENCALVFEVNCLMEYLINFDKVME